jgi:hypothetical protein
MTNEEKISILQRTADRAYEVLNGMTGDDLCDGKCLRLLRAISDLEWMSAQCRRDAAREAAPPVTPEPDPVPAAKPSIPETPKPVASPEPEAEKPAPEKPASGTKLKMADVRGALAKARGKGVNVAEIINSFGVENFQQIPEDQYPAVMAKLEEAGAKNAT